MRRILFQSSHSLDLSAAGLQQDCHEALASVSLLLVRRARFELFVERGQHHHFDLLLFLCRKNTGFHAQVPLLRHLSRVYIDWILCSSARPQILFEVYEGGVMKKCQDLSKTDDFEALFEALQEFLIITTSSGPFGFCGFPMFPFRSSYSLASSHSMMSFAGAL